MTLGLTLVVLALLDSTSTGTLVVPLWLLLERSRPRVATMLLYLGSLVGCYTVLGWALAAGLDRVTAWSGWESPAWDVVLLGVGASLVVLAFSDRALARLTTGAERWRARLADASPRDVVATAVAVFAVELTMMLPYLAAIGLIGASDIGPLGRGALIAGYCAVMALPALVLLVLRLRLHDRIAPTLMRVDGWLRAHAVEATGWTCGLVGFWLAGTAATSLGLIG